MLFLLGAARGLAFPPDPHHLFFGMVRDEYGAPIKVTDAEVILVSASGKESKTRVISGLEPGVNYRLAVPMDSGLTSDLYKPSALRPAVPFQIKVKIGGTTYLPMELKGDFALMGKPGKRTRMDLTLGEDLDGDGLPDAWERLNNQEIGAVNPGDDLDGDGLSNLNEYLAGTYAYDPADGFALAIKGLVNDEPVMEFMAIRGRTYSLVGSADLVTWSPVLFRLRTQAGLGAVLASYEATKVSAVELEAVTATLQPVPTFFKLLVR